MCCGQLVVVIKSGIYENEKETFVIRLHNVTIWLQIGHRFKGNTRQTFVDVHRFRSQTILLTALSSDKILYHLIEMAGTRLCWHPDRR